MEIISKLKNEINYQLNNFPIDKIQELIKKIDYNSIIYFTGIGKSYNMAHHSADLIKSIGLKTFGNDKIIIQYEIFSKNSTRQHYGYGTCIRSSPS